MRVRKCNRGHSMKIANLEAVEKEGKWPYYQCKEHGYAEAL